MLSQIKWIALLMCTSALTAVAQNAVVLPAGVSRPHQQHINYQIPQSSNARSRGLQYAAVNFDYTDSKNDTVKGGVYTRYKWSLGQNIPNNISNNYDLNWAATVYDTIIDALSGTGYSVNTNSFTLDSIIVPYIYTRTSGAADSLIIVVYSTPNGITLNPDAVGGDISDTVLYIGKAAVVTSTVGQVDAYTFYPELNFPSGGKFAIAINFVGSTADTFYILGGGGNLCDDTCADAQSIIPNNAQYQCILWSGASNYTFTTPVGSVFYDCNNDKVLDAGSCEFFYLQDITMQANISISTGPVTPLSATLSSSTVNACPGKSFTLTASASGGTPPYHYSWGSGVTNVNDSTTSGIIPGFPLVGPQVYQVTVTDNFGLSATATDTLMVNGIGVGAGNNATVPCGQTTTLDATVSGNDSDLVATWNNDTSGTTYEDAGPGIYSITVSNGYGCSATSSVQIFSNVSNIASFSGPSSGCLDSIINFTNTSTRTGGWTWEWSFGDGQNLTGASATHTYTGSGQLTVTLTGDSGNCLIEAQNDIAISYCPPPVLTVTITGDTTVCGGTSTTLTAQASGGTGVYTYNWSTETSGTKINVLEGGSYSVTVTDASQTATATVNVIVLPTPTISISGAPNPLCSGASDTLTAVVNGAGNAADVDWFVNGSTLFSGMVYVSSSFNPGDHVYAVVIPSNGCTNVNSDTLIIPSCSGPLSVILLTGSGSGQDSICAGSSVSLNAHGSGGNGTYTYSWAPVTGLSASNIFDPVANPTVTTSYVVTVVSDGDTATGTVMVIVTPQPNVSAGTNVTICGGGSATLEGSGGLADAVYTWSPSTALSCTGCQDPIANPTTATTYSLTVTQGNNCSATAQVTVGVSSSASASVAIVSKPASPCADQSSEFIALPVNGGNASYQWEVNGQNEGTNADTFTLSASNNEEAVVCQMISSLSCVTHDTVTSNIDTISVCAGINETPNDETVKLYPNPNNGQFILSLNMGYSHLTIDILNIEGIVIQTEQIKDSRPMEKVYDLNFLSKGIYLFRVSTESGTVVKRLVIQ